MRRGLLVLAGVGILAAAAVAAPDPVTIRSLGQGALQGTVAAGQPGQTVLIQTRDCGVYPQRFRDLAEAHVSVGGGWAIQLSTGVTSTFRAVWNGKVSKPVTVWQPARVQLQPVASRTAWSVWVIGKTQFWRKRIRFERWDRLQRRWQLVRWVTLTDTGGPAGTGGAITSARFRSRVAKGMLVRAVLPGGQARPCYLAGYSKQFRA